MRVVLDTNIIISAFLWGGKTSKILDLVEDKRITVYTCLEQISELEGVLERTKFTEIFRRTGLRPELIVAGFLNCSLFIEPIKLPDIIKNDPADNVILACAITANVEYLVTGDKHLLTLREFQGIKILKPDEFLKIVK